MINISFDFKPSNHNRNGEPDQSITKLGHTTEVVNYQRIFDSLFIFFF